MLGALWRLLREREEERERERCLVLCFLEWWEECRREWEERPEMTLPVDKSKKPIVILCMLPVSRFVLRCR